MFNRRRTMWLGVAVSLCFASPVFADSTAEEIARINESIALLSAKKAELELKSQIAAKQAEISKLTGADASRTGMVGMDQPLPVVRGIEGVDGKLTATLGFGGGLQQTVKQGEKIRGGWTVAQIEVSSVTLSRGTEKVKLGFGTEPPAASGAPGSGGSSGAPIPYAIPGR